MIYISPLLSMPLHCTYFPLRIAFSSGCIFYWQSSKPFRRHCIYQTGFLDISLSQMRIVSQPYREPFQRCFLRMHYFLLELRSQPHRRPSCRSRFFRFSLQLQPNRRPPPSLSRRGCFLREASFFFAADAAAFALSRWDFHAKLSPEFQRLRW